MKQIKLKKLNRIKYCLRCKEMVEIVMIGRDGYCPECDDKLYTVDCRRGGTF